ncbi:hypothetical protein PPH41_12720, partial [Burkholderia gladioli]|nr:hypothetical protein [Burkholderia gladioli]
MTGIEASLPVAFKDGDCLAEAPAMLRAFPLLTAWKKLFAPVRSKGRASEVAIDAYDAVNPLAKLNMNLAKYGGRVLLGGTDDGISKLRVEGDARTHGDIFATGVGALPVYRASRAALA